MLRMQVRRDAYKLKAWWKVRDLECEEAERGRQARRHRRCGLFPSSSLPSEDVSELMPVSCSVFAKLDDLGFDDIECVRSLAASARAS